MVLAFDNDQAGADLIAKFEAVFAEVDRADLALPVHRPEAREMDWNDVLREGASSSPPPPACDADPS